MKSVAFVFVFLAFIYAQAAVVSERVSYGEGQYEGYLVKPKTLAKPAPGILMIHNWMGVSDETKYQAERFSELGYIVLTADIYGKNVRPKDAKEAGAEATKYKTNRKLFRERMKLALEFLKSQNGVNAKNLAVMGYCFGGTGAIELARSGVSVAAAISFHGSLDSPAPSDGANIKAKVLALHGADDPFVKPEDLIAFENEMKAHKVPYEIIKYPGAVHSFTDKGAGNDPKKGAAYNEEADKKSFEAARKFLAGIFKK